MTITIFNFIAYLLSVPATAKTTNGILFQHAPTERADQYDQLVVPADVQLAIDNHNERYI
jgi:hypothetical protein